MGVLLGEDYHTHLQKNYQPGTEKKTQAKLTSNWDMSPTTEAMAKRGT